MSDSTQPQPSPAVLAAYAAVEDLLRFKPVHTGRFSGWMPAQQRKFIAALAVTGTVERSCRAVGMSVQGAYRVTVSYGDSLQNYRAADPGARLLNAAFPDIVTKLVRKLTWTAST